MQVIERIGDGAFGDVYRAFDPERLREVALKLMRSGVSRDRPSARALREYRNLAKVCHPNVVAVYGVETGSRRAGLWMELIRGVSLGQLLRTRGPFTAEEAAFVGQELCRALAAVHAAGLVHGDIKAQNVMREDTGRIVLMDFGASLGTRATNARLGRLTGTLVYLAPEVLNGGKPTIASDIYSLGVLLFQLVTGDYPVEGFSIRELRRAHARRRGWRLKAYGAALPEAFVEAVEGALADADARFKAADDLYAALSRVRATVPSLTPTRHSRPVSGEWVTRTATLR
jgi:serine/threonine-protein kinase